MSQNSNSNREQKGTGVSVTEMKLLNKLIEWGYKGSFIHNKTADGTNKRPDFIFFTKIITVILENDENQHKDRTVRKENARL